MSAKYRNRFEERTGESLTKRGIRFDYESEKLDYTVEAKYIPDFILITMGGRKIYVETKGNGRSFDSPARRKLIAVHKQHPEKDIRIVFYSNGKCGPKRKDGTFMRQGDWADKHGFIWAIKEIPEEWINE